jgi:hypothetical protein
MAKRVLYASIALTAIVAILAIIDFITPSGVIFARNVTLDVIFVISAGVIIYLAVDALREQK